LVKLLRPVLGVFVVCLVVVAMQSPASAGSAWVFYDNGGITRAYGSGNGGQGAGAANDGEYIFYAEKRTSMGAWALTQVAGTGIPGWMDVAFDGSHGGGGSTSPWLSIGPTALFIRACIQFEGGALACGPAEPIYDDGAP
jgi:hypothetical protein